MKKILSIFLVIAFLFTSGCFNVPPRIYSKEELEDGLIKIELVRIIASAPERYIFETQKVFTLVEQEEVVEELSKITFVQITRPPTRQAPFYALLFIYSDYMVSFSLHFSIGKMDLNGKPIDSSSDEFFFPTGYNSELAKIIEKYLQK